MATKTFEELKQLAIQIRDEKTNKQNTATRVGTEMLEHLNKLEQDYYDKTKTDEELKKRDNKLTELSDKADNLEKESVKNDSEKEQSVSTPSSFKICDREGRVLLKVDERGSSSTAYLVYKEGKLVGTINAEFFQKIITQENGNIYQEGDSLKICDQEGRVFCIISPDGVQAINFLDKEGNVIKNNVENSNINYWCSGKSLYSLCDSLGTAGIWQQRIAELTGMSFDKKLNNNGDNSIAFSVGGTRTGGGENSGFDRIMRIKRHQDLGNPIDVLIIENINDLIYINEETSIDNIDEQIANALPYFEEQWFTYEGKIFSDYTEAWKFFKDNMQTVLNGIVPKKGTIIGLKYISGEATYNVKILSTASNNGQFTLSVGGKPYSISVTTEMSIQDIVNKILEWDYASPNYTDTIGEDGESVNFVAQSGNTSVSYSDTDSTGVKVEISITGGSVSGTTWSFKDLDVENWLEWSSWGIAFNNETVIPAMKGLIEYISKNLNNTKVYWFIPPRFGINFDTEYKRVDGSFDIDSYKKYTGEINYKKLTEIQKAVCRYYNIPVIDMYNYSGLNFTNVYPKYYQNNNVHPTDECYNYLGEQSVKFIV